MPKVWNRWSSLVPRITTTTVGGGSPSMNQQFRETLGRALRETGQAMDRVGLRLLSLSWLPDKYVGRDPPMIFQDFTLSRHRSQMPLLHCGKPVVSTKAAFIAPCATLIGNVTVQEGASIWYGAVLRADTCFNANSFQRSEQDILSQNPPQFLNEDSTKNASDQSLQITPKDTVDAVAAEGAVPDEDGDDRSTTHDNEYEKGGGIFVGIDTNLQDGVLVTAREGSTILGRGVTVGHLAQIHSARVDDFSLIGMSSYLGPGVHVESEAFVAAGAVVAPHTRIRSGELWVGQPARKIRNLTAKEREKLHFQSSEYVQVALSQQHVQELGGNLPPTISLMEAVQYNLEVRATQEESMPDRIARNNLWNKTVYREFLQQPSSTASEQLPPPQQQQQLAATQSGTLPQSQQQQDSQLDLVIAKADKEVPSTTLDQTTVTAITTQQQEIVRKEREEEEGKKLEESARRDRVG